MTGWHTGSSFSASCRAGDQYDAVGRMDQFVDQRKLSLLHAQFRKPEEIAGFVEQPEHHPFAVGDGYGGNTDIDILVSDFNLEAPVLGESFFGNIHLGHDLDPRDQRCLHPFGRGEHVIENAVTR